MGAICTKPTRRSRTSTPPPVAAPTAVNSSDTAPADPTPDIPATKQKKLSTMAEPAFQPPQITSHAPLASQVGGHAGVLASEDGSLIIKPCLIPERDFYQTLSTNEDFALLRKLVPKFYGTLRLEGKVQEGGNLGAVEDGGKESLVLENLSHPFKKANILDIKLGTVLYDDDASEEKRARMEKTARETTSFESGVRLTGFQVYDSTTDAFVNTPKSYGKSIKVSELPAGVAKFFPLLPSGVNKGQGLPRDLLLPVLSGIIAELELIEKAVGGIEMRMVGGSVLVIYEADQEALRAALKKAEEDKKKAVEDEGEEEDEDEEAGNGQKVGPPYAVRLIDFAHTKIVPGKGPDEGVLLGLKTSLQLLTQRKHDVEAEQA